LKQSVNPSLSIILPVHNEKESIERVLLEWIEEIKKHVYSYSFIICEDGSTDGTKELLHKLRKKYNLILEQKQYRRGYGQAVIDGIETATSDYILCIDSDGQCDPLDFKKFWEHRDIKDVVIGRRIFRADPFQRKVFSRLFKTFFSLLFPTHIKDPSAPFVLFKKQTVKAHLSYLIYLKEGFWWGFVGMCVKKNLSLHEIPITHRKRLVGNTKVYQLNHIASIALRNILGLIQMRLSP